jgi:hypothetical protein
MYEESAVFGKGQAAPQPSAQVVLQEKDQKFLQKVQELRDRITKLPEDMRSKIEESKEVVRKPIVHALAAQHNQLPIVHSEPQFKPAPPGPVPLSSRAAPPLPVRDVVYHKEVLKNDLGDSSDEDDDVDKKIIEDVPIILPGKDAPVPSAEAAARPEAQKENIPSEPAKEYIGFASGS